MKYRVQVKQTTEIIRSIDVEATDGSDAIAKVEFWITEDAIDMQNGTGPNGVRFGRSVTDQNTRVVEAACIPED